jgi:hypothetical protein
MAAALYAGMKTRVASIMGCEMGFNPVQITALVHFMTAVFALVVSRFGQPEGTSPYGFQSKLG